MKFSIKNLCTVAAIFASVSLFASTGSAAQKNVRCGTGQTIQDAINTASEGDLVYVSGICNEEVVVSTDSIEIVGLDGATVAADGGVAFTVYSERVVIRDFTLQGAAGVRVERGGSAEIKDNVVDKATNVGIYIGGNSYGNILENEVSGDGNYAGVFVYNNSAAHINNNVVTDTEEGSAISVGGNSSAVLSGNVVEGNHAGISVEESSFIFLPGHDANTIQDNEFGIWCAYSSVIRVDLEQEFSGNTTNVGQSEGCQVRNFVGAPFPTPVP